ncbi:hypothetical protein DFH06DRAFT_1191833 [Mycena polygramma]|nr:hypothetical protein DFH06DRAFT_1191833 [Mycena polygramma]
MQWLSTLDRPAKTLESSDSNPHFAGKTTNIGQTKLDTIESDAPGSLPFVIYSAQPMMERLRSPAGIRSPASPVDDSEDASFSMHTPDAAVAWVEAHYDDPQVEAIRAQRIGGPIATMLFPYEPGLVIFGSTKTQPVLFEVARCLSELSNFPVMIQPPSHNPITKWKAEDEAGTPSFSKNQDGGSCDADCKPSDRGLSAHHVQHGKVSRLRGGAGSDSESDSDLYKPRISNNHSITHHLQLARSNLKQNTSDVNIVIESNTHFTVQTEYKNKRREGPRPQVISHTELKVHPQHGVHPDRSYSRVGFVIDEHPEHRLFKPTWIDQGFGLPGQTLKTTRSELEEKNAELDLGKTTMAKLGRKWTKGKAKENTSDRVTPKWLVGHELGPILQADQSNNMCGISYNIGYEPTEFDWGTPVEFPLEVQFSVGINVTAHKNGRNIKSDKLPTKVAFRVLHQTMLWIRNNDLKTKGVGMVVLSSHTIPDIQTMDEFSTAEYHVIDLERISQSATATVSLAGPHNSQDPSIFLATGVEPIITRSRIGAYVAKTKSKLEGLFNYGNGPSDFTLHPLVVRGWDASQGEWKRPVYSMLDENFWNVDRNPHKSSAPKHRLVVAETPVVAGIPVVATALAVHTTAIDASAGGAEDTGKHLAVPRESQATGSSSSTTPGSPAITRFGSSSSHSTPATSVTSVAVAGMPVPPSGPKPDKGKARVAAVDVPVPHTV